MTLNIILIIDAVIWMNSDKIWIVSKGKKKSRVQKNVFIRTQLYIYIYIYGNFDVIKIYNK